jgi:acyl-CoA dehydrogenase
VSSVGDRDGAFLTDVRQIADSVAGPQAEAIDRDARFPVEAVDALRERSALSAFVPTELGGGGVSISALAQACAALGRRCGTTGLVYAMHQIQVASIQRHYADTSWFADYLHDLARDQRLIASATSEVGTGGDMSRSVAAVIDGGDGTATFEKQAPVISYGEHADDLLTTVRRAPDVPDSDQVMVLTRRDQMTLKPSGTWDSLGMRGTCSSGATVHATFDVAQVLPTPFSTIAAETMVPITHVLWSHVWLGIAEDAFERARACARASIKRSAGQPEATDERVSHVFRDLSLLRAQVADGLRDFVRADAAPDRRYLTTMAAVLAFNTLKIASSEMTEQVCRGALMVCGIHGYKNDTPFSVGRHLRDALSASLMIANHRMLETNARLLLVAKDV